MIKFKGVRKKVILVDEEVYNMLWYMRNPGETWGSLLRRLAEAVAECRGGRG